MLDENIVGDQVGPCRHDLPELHKRWAEVLQDLPKPYPRRHSPGIAALAARNQGAEPRPIDDLTEAVDRKDGRDLPKAL